MDNSEALKKITKGTTIVLFGLFIGKVLGYLSRLVMARFFGAELYGLFAIASTVLAVLTLICLLGTNSGINRFIPFYMGKKDESKVKGTVVSALKITMPFGIILSIITFLLSETISVGIFNKPDLVPMIQVFSLVLPFSVLIYVLTSTLRGLQNMKYYTYTWDISKSAVTLIMIVLFFYLGFGIIGAVYAYYIGYVLACILGIYFVNKAFPIFRKSIKAKPITKTLFLFSLPIILGSFMRMIMNWFDIFMLGVFVSSAEVGIYSMAIATAALVLVMAEAFNYIYLPVASEMFGKGDLKGISVIYKSVVKWVFSLSFPLFLIMVFFPSTILNILFGGDFVNGSVVLGVLSFGYLMMAVSTMAIANLIAIGKTKINLLNMSISAAINFALNLILIPVYGIFGAGIATGASLLVLALLSNFYSYKYNRVLPFDRNYLKILIAGFVSITIFYVSLKTLFVDTPDLVLVVLFPLFLVLYGLLFLVMRGFEKNDLYILKEIEKKLGINSKFLRRVIKRFI